MNKAIVIVDIPDDFKFKKSYADIALVDGKHNMLKRIAKVKPMPEKKDMFCETSYILLENRGYNSCIDEILGEIEDE